MFSQTTIKRLSLGAAAAIWLALGSAESANAFSMGGTSPVASTSTADQHFELLSKAGSVITISVSTAVVIFQLLALLDGGGNNQVSTLNPDKNDPNKPFEGFDFDVIKDGTYKATILTPSGKEEVVKIEVKNNGPVPVPVPAPALLPALIALGLKVRHKRRSEQSGAL